VAAAGVIQLLTLGAAHALVTPSVTVTTSLNPAMHGQSVTFTATVTGSAGTPTGTVIFEDNGTMLGTASLISGSATFTTSSLTIGNHSISAFYSGDSTYQPANNSLPQAQVITGTQATTTSVSSSSNPSTFEQSVTFTATVSSAGGTGGTPTGTVTFIDSGSMIGTGTLSGGVASFATSSLTPGNHNITAIYAGQGNFLSSTSSPLTQTINRIASTTSLTSSINPSSVGQAITLTATVSGSGGPTTGTVTFMDGATTLGTSSTTGSTASLTISSLAAGNHSLTAVYSGNLGFVGSTSAPLTQTVNQTASMTTITSSLNPSALGQSVTFHVTVTGSGGTPTGAVTFRDGGTAIGAGALNGSGMTSFTTSSLAAGSHTITATYGGNTNFAGSTGQVTQNVNTGTTTTALTSSVNPSAPGQAVTFTATVSGGGGMPTGTVTFKDGGATIGTGTLSNGAASFTIASLATGNHTITAAYGGNGSFAASASPALTQAVAVPGDSVKLREMQISTTPMIAQVSGQAITGAADAAVAAGFGGNPQMMSPNGSGFTYYFNGETAAENDPDRDSLKRYLEAPDGSNRRVDQSFQALGYAGMPVKAPPLAAPRCPVARVAGLDRFPRHRFLSRYRGERPQRRPGQRRRRHHAPDNVKPSGRRARRL
jgi:hypothetical protein